MPAGTGMGGSKIGEAYVDVGANTSALQAGMAQAQRTFDKKASAIEARAQKMASTLQAAWKATAVGTAALTAGVGKAVDMYMEFEDTQVELQKKLGASRDVISGLTSGLTDLSMQLPTTRQELTEIAAEAAKVGVSEENIVAYTKTMKMFEEATGMAAEKAALFFGRINAISQAPISTVENLGSALAYLLDNFPVAEAEKISQVMLKMGRTVIGAMGASQAELAGLSTAISSISKRASRPATQLRRAFMEMGEKTAEYASIVKMETNDLADAINDNAINAFVDWVKRFKELYGASNMTVERIRAFADVSQAAAKGILPFVSNVDLMEDALEAARREFGENEALALKYEIALTRLSTQLEITRGNVATAAQAFGGIFAPAVRNLNENVLQPFTERLVYIMTQSAATRDAIRNMVMAFIRVGGAITAIGLVVKALTMLVNPVFQIMALAGLLWAAWELNFMNIRGAIKNTVMPAWDDFTSAVTDFVNEKPWSGLSDLGDALGGIFEKVGGSFGIEWEEPEKEDIKGNLKSQLEAVKIANIVAGVIATAVGIMTLGASGSFVLAGLSSYLTLKWGTDDLKKNLASAIENGYDSQGTRDLIADSLDAATGAVLGYAVTGSAIGATAGALIKLNFEKFLPENVKETIETDYNNEDFKDQVVKGLMAGVAGIVTYSYSGSYLASAVSAKLVLDFADFGIQGLKSIWGALSTKLNNWLVNKMRDMEWWPGGPKVHPNFGELKGPAGDKAEFQKNKRELEDLADKYKNVNLFDQSTVNTLYQLIQRIESANRDLSDETQNLLSQARSILDQAIVEPDKKRLGGPVKKQKGGGIGQFIPGYGGGDQVPALLERGEFVWNKEMVKRFPGLIKGLWERHRQGGIVGMASGGEAKLSSGTGETYDPGDYPGLQRKIPAWKKYQSTRTWQSKQL